MCLLICLVGYEVLVVAHLLRHVSANRHHSIFIRSRPAVKNDHFFVGCGWFWHVGADFHPPDIRQLPGPVTVRLVDWLVA